MLSPRHFVFYCFTHRAENQLKIRTSRIHLFTNDVRKQTQVSDFVVLDVLDHLGSLYNLVATCQLVEEVETLVEVDAFQHKVCNKYTLHVFHRWVSQEVLSNRCNVLVACFQNSVSSPLVVDLFTGHERIQRIQNYLVALRVDYFLEQLNGNQVTNSRSCDEVLDVWQIVGLEAVEEDQERQGVLYSFVFFWGQTLDGDLVFRQVDFLRNPMVTNHDTEGRCNPIVFYVIEVADASGLSTEDFLELFAILCVLVEEGATL
ncbi:hypothetical protein D3C80_1202410 [compost metagenome]